MLEPGRFVDTKMKQESNKSLLFKISCLANVSLELLREELLAFANCYQPGGESRANLEEGQLVVGALKNFQKLVTRVRLYNNFRPLLLKVSL